jgi:UTP--glucose-1-phosphate uridylyltransferase
MSNVRKAVIPVAGHGTRLYPATKAVKKELFPVVTPSGLAKPLIQVIVEEAVESGIEEVCLIVQPGDDQVFREYFEGDLPSDLKARLHKMDWALEESRRIADLGRRISYVEQPTPEGYGHAVYCSHEWVGQEPFLILLGDHIYVSTSGQRCARQLIDAFGRYGRSMSAVARTHESDLRYFGTIAGERIENDPRVVRVTHIKEKPEAGYARQHLRVPGLPLGEYLCWFGQHLFTPGIFDALKYHLDNDLRENGEIQLTSAQELLRQQEGVYYAYETEGRRYDTGIPCEYAKTVCGFSGLAKEKQGLD